VGFVFGAIAVCALAFTILFVPECKGVSLEQLNVMFHEGVPLRDFGKHAANRRSETEYLKAITKDTKDRKEPEIVEATKHLEE
jgi:MFS transporter, SP family, sugar:H+ symporter